MGVLLVSDPGVVNAGWVIEIEQLLLEQGLGCVRFTDVSPNPRSEEVMRGAEIYREQGCDVIVAVGGGSPMDCAKGIGIVSAHGEQIRSFEGIDQINNPIPPLVF